MTAQQSNYPLVAAISNSPYAAEFFREIEATRASSLGGDLTAQQMEQAAAAVAMRHGPELLQANLIAEGHAPDVTKLPASYLRQLNQRDTTNDDVAEVARRLRPDLAPSEALRAWEAKAAKLGDPQPDFYEPGRSRPAEDNG